MYINDALGQVGFISNVRNQEANAHLIAAAPEMYEALEALVFAVNTFAISPTEVLDENSPIMDAIRVALKKARGEA